MDSTITLTIADLLKVLLLLVSIRLVFQLGRAAKSLCTVSIALARKIDSINEENTRAVIRQTGTALEACASGGYELFKKMHEELAARRAGTPHPEAEPKAETTRQTQPADNVA